MPGAHRPSPYLHEELAAAVAQQLVQTHLHIKGGPLPADVQVLPRQSEAHTVRGPPRPYSPPHRGPSMIHGW